MGMAKDSKAYPPLKEDAGNRKETPPATSDGHVIGSTTSSKGFNKTGLIKHDGIVVGGSVTKKNAPTPKKSIDKLPSGGKRNIVGGE